jgi:hypothetical protein
MQHPWPAILIALVVLVAVALGYVAGRTTPQHPKQNRAYDPAPCINACNNIRSDCFVDTDTYLDGTKPQLEPTTLDHAVRRCLEMEAACLSMCEIKVPEWAAEQPEVVYPEVPAVEEFMGPLREYVE